MNRIAVNACPLCHFSTEFESVTLQELNSTAAGFVAGFSREDPEQSTIVVGRPMECVVSPLLAIVLAESRGDFRQFLDPLSRSIDRSLARDRFHNAVNVFQLLQRRPSLVLPFPSRPGGKPHGERLGKIFGRMCLRIPGREM